MSGKFVHDLDVQVLFVLLQPHPEGDMRRRPQVAASVQTLIEGHPMVQQYLVSRPLCILDKPTPFRLSAVSDPFYCLSSALAFKTICQNW